MFLQVIYAFIVSLGFGVLFNVRDKNLFFAALGGAVGWFFYSLTMNLSNSSILAMLIASISISIYAEIFSRVLKNPVTLFLVCSLIPLVPGSGMYYTVFEAVEGNVFGSLNNGIETLSLAGVIAVGIILVSTLSRLMQKLKIRRNQRKLGNVEE
ncbi:membrane protein [Clostridium sulfidigenes]|uniref:Membrane protein n=1 Tax=Clostridium sulfidigenes TaxID=318464 RepID=A0A084J969_9CLOT|nr:threonine/serine exporter family protein [Clostridium sulfidigenes]KEZ85503.1 membrane protein [Clostridium sulfidigenes]